MHAHSQVRFPTGALVVACSAVLFLAACQQSRAPGGAQGITEIAWARMALERNPNLEVVATDIQAGVFTVRDRRTGQVQTVKLGELAAAPISQLNAQVVRPSVQATTAEPVAPETSPAEAAKYDTRAGARGARDYAH